MFAQRAQVIDLEEYRRRRAARGERARGDKEEPSAPMMTVPVALFWCPVWTWVPLWPMR